MKPHFMIARRKRAAQAVRESKERYRHLADSNIFGFVISELGGHINEANDAFLKMVGFSRQDLRAGKIDWKSMTPPEFQAAETGAIHELQQTGTCAPFEKEFVRKDGRRIPVMIGSAFLEGSQESVVGFVFDLTQRKRAEESLRRSEANLLEAQRLGHMGSFATDVSSGAFVASPEFLRIFGFSPDEKKPTVEMFQERIHPADRPSLLEMVKKARSEKTDYELAYRIVLPDGSIRHAHSVGHPVFNESNDLVEFVGTTLDVTERKRADEALRAAEEVARGQVEALAQNLDILATATAPENLIGQMLSTIGRFLNAQSVVLWLLDEANDSLVLRAAAEGENFAAADPEHPLIKDPGSWKSDSWIQEMFFTGAPAAVEEIDGDPRVSSDIRDYFRSKGTRKFLGIPTLMGGEVKGFIGIRHGDRPPYRPEEIELAQALAHQAMFAVQLDQFAEQSRLSAVLEERNRMARDIHDTLAQGLTGVIVQLQAAEDATSKGYKKDAFNHLQSAADLARKGLNEGRRSVRALRPQALEEATFWEALQTLIKNATAGTGLHAEFQRRGRIRELSPLAQENLLHIGQEALTNTLKYAHATRFEARLSFNATEVRLELQDDGVGFKTNGHHGGFGLTGMQERVTKMGGV